MKTSVGIIGAGSFGIFLAEKLEPFCDVKVHSSSGKKTAWTAMLAEVAECDFVIPCIPVDAYENVLTDIKPHLKATTVIVDVCSVKEQPIEIIKHILPNQPVVATHPLFGPQSAKDSLKDQVLVLCADGSEETALQTVDAFARKLDLKVVKLSMREHDEEMAVVQGLTFFIAHVLKDMGLHHQKLETPSFRRLLHLAELEGQHSDDLFKTIQVGNARTAVVRDKFIAEAERINRQLNS